MIDIIKNQAEQIAKLLEEKKAEDVVVLHVGDRTIIADYFVICSGRNVPHVKALCEDLDKHSDELQLTRLRQEGYAEGRWIVCDYGAILVHIFHPEERSYYNMERLWSTNE